MTTAPRPRGGAPVTVWLLVALQALLALGWTQLAAPWRAPDEPHHHDLVRVVRAEPGWVGDDRVLSAQIVGTFDELDVEYAAMRELPPLSADDAPAGAQRRTFAEIDDDEPSWAANWLWQHPPLHYVITAGALILGEALTPGDPPDYLAEIAAARAVSALMVAPLPLLVFLAGRRIGAGVPAAAGAAGLTLAVPQLAHVGGSVNNDNLLILLVGAATLPLLGMATGDARTRTAALAGTLLGLALLTKGFALIGVGLLPLAAVVGALRRVGRLDAPARWAAVGRDAARPAVVGLATMAVVGGWWLVRNVARHGALTPHSYDPDPLEGAEPSVWAWLAEAVPSYVVRFWGSFGWFQAEVPLAVAVVATLALAGLVLTALWRTRRDVRGLAVLAVALAPFAAIAVGVAWRAWSLHVEYGFLPLLHGRYVLPGLVGLLAVVAVAVDGPATGRWWPPVVAVAGAAMTLLSVAVAADAFWVGDGLDALASMAAWSAWPTWLGAAWALASAAVLAALTAALMADRAHAEVDVEAPSRP